MSSPSTSDYRDCCRAYLSEVRQRPRMYFRELAQLEILLVGHGYAFFQLGWVQQGQTFNDRFRKWVYRSTRVSTSAGWARAVETLAGRQDADIDETFFSLLDPFWDSNWGDDASS